jgi:hypothetical protein
MLKLLRRLATREKQFVAWRHLIEPQAYRAARNALVVTDVARAVLGFWSAFFVARQPASLAAIAAIVAVIWGALSLLRAVARDRILAGAFAHVQPPAPASTPSPAPAPVPFVPRAPRPRTAPRRRHVEDRDALDFDDAA